MQAFMFKRPEHHSDGVFPRSESQHFPPHDDIVALLPAEMAMVPLVRLSVCGLFEVEVLQAVQSTPDGDIVPVYGPPEARFLRRKGPALSLLKLLISQPHGFATKDWLVEHLRSRRGGEDEEAPPLVRFDNVVSSLRGLLCPQGLSSEDKLKKLLLKRTTLTPTSGEGYRLAGLPHIWMDAQAIGEHVRRARSLEERGEDAFSEWESAATIGLRGEFLVEEVYSDWAKSRREEVRGFFWQSVRVLWRLYVVRKQQGRAIEILQAYWFRYPRHEEALCPLLLLLAECGQYQQVEEYYAKLCQILEEEGQQPKQPTLKTIAALRSRQGQGEPLSFIASGFSQSSLPVLTEEDQQSNRLFSHKQMQDIIDVETIGKSQDVERQTMDIHRRQFLQWGVGATGALLNTTSEESLSRDLEVAERLAKILKGSYSIDDTLLAHLMIEARNNRKRFVLSKNSIQDMHSMHSDGIHNLSMITQLLEKNLTTPVYQLLCTLAGEASQLLGDICFHKGKSDRANYYYDIAMRAAVEAKNETLQAVLLGRRCFTALYANNVGEDGVKDVLPFLHQAHQLSAKHTHDLIRAWLFVVEAEVQAAIGEKDACYRALQQSEQILHQGRTGYATCSFSTEEIYAPLNQQRLLGYMGACYIRLGQPQKAIAVLQPYCSSLNYASIQKRSITLIDLAHAYALEDEVEEMEKYTGLVFPLLEQTKSVRSVQRLFSLRRSLRRWEDTTYVKRLDQQLATISHSVQIALNS